MFYAPMRLECAELETLILNTNGLEVVAVDLGDAETRVVVDEAPDADGTDDTTTYLGARVITMTIRMNATTWATRQALKAYTHPRLRPTLIFQIAEDAPVQQATVRRGAYSDPIPAAMAFAGQLDVTVQWVAPYGIIESAELHSQTLAAVDPSVAAGFTFPLTFPFTFPSAGSAGVATFVNAGTADAYPKILIYGPCVDPVIENITANLSLAFTGLTINAGEYLEIDTRARTILYQSDPDDSRYDALDFPTSQWFTLAPGDNLLRLNPASFSVPSQMVIEWRDAYL